MASSSMPLLFLRPMALPRPSTIHCFLGIAKASTTATSASSSPVPPPPAQAATPAKPKPYRITLTPSKNLPVYTLAKRGGNMKLTKVRRIEGDVTALRNDLRAALELDEKEVTINQLTRQIIVKVCYSWIVKLLGFVVGLICVQGHKKPEIEKFLKEQL
jgi:large subunit ribosomal protein L49